MNLERSGVYVDGGDRWLNFLDYCRQSPADCSFYRQISEYPETVLGGGVKRTLIAQGEMIKHIQPIVWMPQFFGHKFGTMEVMGRVAAAVGNMNVNTQRIIGFIHDDSRLITNQYGRNELVGVRMWVHLGINEQVRQVIPQMESLVDIGTELGLTQEDIEQGMTFLTSYYRGSKDNNAFISKLAGIWETIIQEPRGVEREILRVADNLAKPNPSLANLLTFEEFIGYINNQEERYEQKPIVKTHLVNWSPFPSVRHFVHEDFGDRPTQKTGMNSYRREMEAQVQAGLVELDLSYFKRMGVDVEKIIAGVGNEWFMPEFLLKLPSSWGNTGLDSLLARHRLTGIQSITDEKLTDPMVEIRYPVALQSSMSQRQWTEYILR